MGSGTTAYNLVLDVYPLLDRFPNPEGSVLATHIAERSVSLALLFENAAPWTLCEQRLRELRLLLSCANELGYLEADVFEFLIEKMHELSEELEENTL